MALLQEQNHRLREKVQLKSEVIRRQEALVMEMKQRVADLEQRLAAGVQAVQTAQQKEESGKAELEAVRSRLVEAERLVESNQKVCRGGDGRMGHPGYTTR